jgi:hypothetical protein
MKKHRDVVEIEYTNHGHNNSIVGYFMTKTDINVSLALERKWFPGQTLATYTNYKHVPIHRILRVSVLRSVSDTSPCAPSSSELDAPIVGC